MSVNKDAAIGIFGILFGAALFALSFQVKDFASVGVGAGFLPRFAALLFFLIGAVLAFQCVRSGGAPRPAGKPAPEKGSARRVNPVLLSMLLLCAYVALLQPVGFIVCSALYVFFQSMILSAGAKRNYVALAAISSVASATAYFLFVRVFQVMIPAGILG